VGTETLALSWARAAPGAATSALTAQASAAITPNRDCFITVAPELLTECFTWRLLEF
jgi:hypothetical protein